MKQKTLLRLCEGCHFLLLSGIQHRYWDMIIYRSNKHVLVPKISPQQPAQPCVNREFFSCMKQQMRIGKERIWKHFLVRKNFPVEA